MKESLRSAVLSAKPEGDSAVLGKEEDEETEGNGLVNGEKGFDLNVEIREVSVLEDLDLNKVPLEGSPEKSMEIDEGMVNGLENVECEENDHTRRRGRKRGRGGGKVSDGADGVDRKKLKAESVDGSDSDVVELMKAKEEVADGGGGGGDGVEKKKVKGAAVNGKVVMLGRTLRSRTMEMRGLEKEKTGIEVKVVMGRNGSVKEETDSEFKVNGGSVEEETGGEIEVDEGRSRSVVDRISNRGNKQPVEKIVKAEKVESKRSVNGISKILKRKRGRPPKMQGGKLALKADKKGKVLGLTKREKDSKLVAVVKHESLDNSYSGKKLSGKELNPKRVASAGKGNSDVVETEDRYTSSRMKSECVSAPDDEKKIRNKGKRTLGKKETNGTSKSKEKQLLRQRIIDMLLGFGWKVEYRPRKGREYNDSVYVSPEGRGYWSVTLAYRMLKKRFEDGDGDSKGCSTSSVFTPIPEEELKKLTKITKKGKERELKLKKKKKGVRNPDEVVIDKKPAKKKRDTENIRSLSHTAKKNSMTKLGSKLSKGRLKKKLLHHDKSTSTGMSKLGMPISVGNHNSQETQNRKRCALLARSCKDGQNLEGDGYALYPWKRTVLTWMIDLGILPLNGKVQYLNRRKTRVILEGKITRDGIQCGCCDEIVSVAKFETHSGSKLSQPLQNICLESGTSLLQCQLKSWNKQKESERKGFHHIGIDGDDPNDDTCGVCGDGGDLICCDSCPSTFHQSCVDIQKFPSGDWHCVYCLCKFCGMDCGNTYGRDDNHEITSSLLSTCHLCEEKYHQLCVQAEDSGIDDPGDSSFCGKNCQELFERLQMLLGVEHELEEGFSWSLIKRSDVDSDFLLNRMPQKIKSNSKLAVALSIMDECFLPFTDHRTGINLLRNILYNFGSNFNRLNYSGFYTAILERGDEIISAASIRIHGCQLAEMPFIATRHMYRRQGMCSRLLSAIERALRSLNVEKLVIPAISELIQTWTTVFGFKPLEISKRREMKHMNMLVFPGTDMLQKPLLEHQYSEDIIIPTADLKSDELRKAIETSQDTNTSNEGVTPHANGINYETIAQTGSQLPDGSLNVASDLTNDAINSLESAEAKRLVQLDMTSHTPDRAKETVVFSDISACDAHEGNEQDTARETNKDHNVIPNCIFPETVERCTEQHSELNEGVNCEESVSLVASHDVSMEDTSNEGVTLHADGINYETISKTCSQLPDGSLNDVSDLTNDAINFLESDAASKRLVQLDMTGHTLDMAKETLVDLDISSCDSQKGNEQDTAREINKDHNVIPSCIFPAPEFTEQHSKSDEGGNCVESVSLMASHDASMVNPETVFSEVGRIVGNVTNDFFPPDVMSVSSTGFGVTQVQNVAKHGLEASCQNIVCHDSEATIYVSHNFQQLQVSGCSLEANGKEIGSPIQTCKSFDVATNPTSSSNNRANGCASLADDCDLNSSIQVDGFDCHKQVGIGSAETNCDLMSGDSEVIAEPDFQTSCILSSHDGVNHCNVSELTMDNLNGPKVAPTEPQTGSYSFDGDIVPDNSQKATISLKQSDSESLVDHNGVTMCNSKCNSSSASGVALLCAPGGCNACGAPEAIVLSNQAS